MIFPYDTLASDGKPTIEEILQVHDSDIVQGNNNAKVTMLEYSSLTCPHCAKFRLKVYKDLKRKYIDTGRLRYVYRSFPSNRPALLGSMLAYCSKGEYMQVMDILFQTQNKWAFYPSYQEELLSIMRLSGMTEKEFNACIENEEIQSLIINRMMDALVLKIYATPVYFINGKRIEGYRDIKYISDIIDSEIEASKLSDEVNDQLQE